MVASSTSGDASDSSDAVDGARRRTARSYANASNSALAVCNIFATRMVTTGWRAEVSDLEAFWQCLCTFLPRLPRATARASLETTRRSHKSSAVASIFAGNWRLHVSCTKAQPTKRRDTYPVLRCPQSCGRVSTCRSWSLTIKVSTENSCANCCLRSTHHGNWCNVQLQRRQSLLQRAISFLSLSWMRSLVMAR